jgi:hypothetical protein
MNENQASEKVLERFNQVYKDFLEDLHKTFGFDIGKTLDNFENYVKYILPHMDNISVCNEDFFKMTKESVIYLGDNISLLEVLNHKEYQKKKTKVSFWKYLHTFYILSTKLVDKIKIIVDNLETDKNIPKESIKMIHLVLSSQDSIMENLKKNKPESIFVHDTFPELSSKSALNKKLSNEISEINKELDEDENPTGFMGDSLIGKLAEDLTKKIKVNPEDLKNMGNPFDLFSSFFGAGAGAGEGGGTNPPNLQGGLGNIFTTILTEMNSKFASGELDGQKLFAEANKMMGGIFPQPPEGGVPGQMPNFPQMDAEAQANFFRQMGAMGMMNQMKGMNLNKVSKNAKKKIIKRKKNK